MQKRLGVVQPFTLSASSQASAKLGAQTDRVRIAVSSTGVNMGGAFVLFGDSTGLTVSSSNGSFIPATWAEDFDVTRGQTFYCIEASTSHGALTLTEYA